MEEDEWERAADADCGCSGVKGVRCFVGVDGVDGDVGTKGGMREGGVSSCRTGRETPVAYHKHIRGGFYCLLLLRYQQHERTLSTPQRDDGDPQR